MEKLYNLIKEDPIPLLLALSISCILGGIVIELINSTTNKVTMHLEIHTLSNGIISLPIRSQQVPLLTNKQIHIIGISLDRVKE